MTCDEFRRLADGSHPADVTAAEFAAGMTHMAVCPACEGEQRRKTAEAMKLLSAEEKRQWDCMITRMTLRRAAECVADPEIGRGWLKGIAERRGGK